MVTVGNLTATRPPQPWTAPSATDPVASTLRLPGSKSITARALLLSALATGPSTLLRPLRARDTELMAGGLRALGAHMSIADDERWLVRPHPLAGPATPRSGSARSARWSRRSARSAYGSTPPGPARCR